MSGLTISNIDNGEITLESTSFNIQSHLNVDYLLVNHLMIEIVLMKYDLLQIQK